MDPYIYTTPFGRRALSLAHVATQAQAKARPPEKGAHKWHVYQAICIAKPKLGVSERALAVLNALLTFYPDTVLTGDDLVVFPSNDSLSRRAHGMASSTLRRHLAVLVDAGLIIRRDSPNGKRYARRNQNGVVDLVFGFDLSPLVARAEEFEQVAAEILAAERELKRVRERITLCRRDITKMIITGMEEGIPTLSDRPGISGWDGIQSVFRAMIARVQRTAGLDVLKPLAHDLTLLAAEIANLLEVRTKQRETSANESQSERHIQNSKTKTPVELELALQESEAAKIEAISEFQRGRGDAYPLGLVLDACPDILDYAKDGIAHWRDLVATAAVIRPMLGISPSAWEEALAIMGEIKATIVVAAILQRSPAISSAGGYLRELTRKAGAGEFSVGPMLMALVGSRRRARKSA